MDHIEIKITDEKGEVRSVAFDAYDLAFFWEPVPLSPIRLYMKTGPAYGLKINGVHMESSWQLRVDDL